MLLCNACLLIGIVTNRMKVEIKLFPRHPIFPLQLPEVVKIGNETQKQVDAQSTINRIKLLNYRDTSALRFSGKYEKCNTGYILSLQFNRPRTNSHFLSKKVIHGVRCSLLLKMENSIVMNKSIIL